MVVVVGRYGGTTWEATGVACLLASSCIDEADGMTVGSGTSPESQAIMLPALSSVIVYGAVVFVLLMAEPSGKAT